MNFDKIVPRTHTNSLKWDGADRLLHANSEGMWENSKAFSLPEDFLPMWAADMDFTAPEEVLNVLQQRIKHGVLGYCIRPESYHQAFINWLEKRHRWHCQPEWLLYCPGVLPAINLAIDTFSEMGDGVVIQPPVYYRFFQAIQQNGRKLLTNPLIEQNGVYSMNFDHLESLFKQEAKLLILCNPHNPTGTCWEHRTLQTLAQLCEQYNITVISDEIHADLVFKGNQHLPLASISEAIAQRTITCLAPSKTFNLAGLRTASLVIPSPEKHQKMQRKIAQYGLDVSNVFGLLAFEAAYSKGGNWLEALMNYLEKNVALITEFAAQHPYVRFTPPQATHMVWLDFRDLNIPSEEMKKRLIQQGNIGLSDGKTYFGKEGEGFQRMNIGCATSQVAEGLGRIEKAFSML